MVQNAGNTRKNRNMNIELLRIILMLMIVTLHYLGHEGILESALTGNKFILVWTLETFCYVGVNGFVIISGYYLVSSTLKIKKLLALILQIVSTAAIIYITFVALGLAPISKQNALGAIFPVLTGRYWFATSYIGLYCLVPFLNIIVKNTTKQQMQVLLFLLSALFCSWNAFFPILTTVTTQGGYSVVWLVCLYFFSAYLRLYWKYDINKYIYLLGFVLCCLFVAWKKCTGNALFLSYVSVPITIASLLLFLFFRDVKIKNHLLRNAIAYVSPLTFGVYLISDNVWMRSVLYSKILYTTGHSFGSSEIVWIIPASVIAIFVGSMLLEQVRRLIFAPLINSGTYQRLCDKISTSKFLEGYASVTKGGNP